MRHVRGICSCLLLSLVPVIARADDDGLSALVALSPPVQLGGQAHPSWEFGGGYNFLRILEGGGANFPVGWYGTVVKNVNETIGIVGEITGNHDRDTLVSTDIVAYLGGVRFSFRRERVTPFVSVLGGLSRTRTRADLPPDPVFGGLSFDVTSTDFVLQGGGGVDITLAPNWAVSAGADYQTVFSDGDTANLFRLHGGILYRTGSGTPSPSSTQPAMRARAPAVARGGAPRNEISVEYAFLRELGDEGDNVPIGWNVSYARNLGRSLGVVGEIGTSYRREGDVSAALWDFMGGVRFSARGESAVTPYVEGLGGLAVLGVTDGLTIETFTEPALQVGGGIDISINPNLALRGGVDYRAIFADGDTANLLRVRGGVVFGFGGRTADDAPAAPAPLVPEPARPPQRDVPEAPAPPPQEPVRIEPPQPEPEAEPPPRRGAPPPPPAPPPAPQPPPPAPVSDYERGRSLLRDGNYELAAVAFMVHLRQEGTGKFTVAVGLFCDRNNVAAHVVNSGYASEFFLLSVPRSGQTCYGAYWGLYDSRAEAQQAIGTLPAAIRATGQIVLPVSRIVR